MESPKPPIKIHQQEQPPPPERLKCPRCESSNTKFCYYNNYNKSQPRHYCKACKRHWTKGGMLRNVPVGGGRKNKRLKTSSKSAKTATSANIGASLPFGLENENSMKKMINQVDLAPQSFLQDGLFNNAMDFCIGRSLSHESSLNDMFGSSSVLSIPQGHDLTFPCPSFTTLEENYPCTITGSCHTLESVATGHDQTLGTGNWVWDDIDNFATSDVTISWDDEEIN